MNDIEQQAKEMAKIIAYTIKKEFWKKNACKGEGDEFGKLVWKYLQLIPEEITPEEWEKEYSDQDAEFLKEFRLLHPKQE